MQSILRRRRSSASGSARGDAPFEIDMFVGAGYGGVLALGIACSSDAIIDANVAILVLPAILAIALIVLVLIRAAVAVLAHRLAGGGEAIILGGRAILTDPATRALALVVLVLVGALDRVVLTLSVAVVNTLVAILALPASLAIALIIVLMVGAPIAIHALGDAVHNAIVGVGFTILPVPALRAGALVVLVVVVLVLARATV